MNTIYSNMIELSRQEKHLTENIVRSKNRFKQIIANAFPEYTKCFTSNDIYGAKSKTKAKLAYFDSFFKGMAIKQNIETYYLPHLDEMDINVKDILSVIKDDMTEAQKVRAVYDKFLSTVSYGEKNSRGPGNIRGAFLNMVQPTDPPIRFVVCQGYAQGLNYLLKRVGIQSIMIVRYLGVTY